MDKELYMIAVKACRDVYDNHVDLGTTEYNVFETKYQGEPLKVIAIAGNTISTVIDSSTAPGDYTYAYSGNQAVVKRCVKFTVGSNDAIVVEEVQVVGG